MKILTKFSKNPLFPYIIKRSPYRAQLRKEVVFLEEMGYCEYGDTTYHRLKPILSNFYEKIRNIMKKIVKIRIWTLFRPYRIL